MKLNTKNVFLLKIAIAVAVILPLNAEQTINSTELYSYTVQKHRVDFNAQTDQSKNDIMNEYLKTLKLSDSILKSDFKNNVDFKVANRLLAINMWAEKTMSDTKVSKRTLERLYKKHSPKTEARYQLRNILLKNKSEANKIEKSLLKMKKTKRLKEFEKLVQSKSEDFTTRVNQGKIGWVDSNKLSLDMRDSLKEKNVNDVIKVNVENIGWQVILVENFQPAKKATFEESKDILTKVAKQEILSKKIEKILK